MAGLAAPPHPSDSRSDPPLRLDKVLVGVTEDWFALSHFKPLIRFLASVAREVVVVARSSGRFDELEALGARPVDFDFHRSSLDPVREMRSALALGRLIRSERPDVVHLIAMKPIVLGALAAETGAPMPHAVVHMTGLGFIAISEALKVRLARRLVLRLIGRLLGRPTSWLLVENSDDLAFLRRGGADAGHRVTVLGGAGIDPDEFQPAAPRDPARVVAAFTGRMIRSKGVELLMAAQVALDKAGVPLAIELYGRTDRGNPEAIPAEALEAWMRAGHGRWHGHVADVASVLRSSDIFVLPALSREGMPRALLEAAATALPAIVSDVPGCRHFTRNGIEGLLVPPGDLDALVAALRTLALDGPLRRRLGAAARRRVLDGFTIDDVARGLAMSYRAMLANGPSAVSTAGRRDRDP